ncbi:MAG TPA: hypothetical protein VKU19_06505 [Bryobacteraceae bacterium]|nr:hypothetical protein [Bryobacteraceae bacterium]
MTVSKSFRRAALIFPGMLFVLTTASLAAPAPGEGDVAIYGGGSHLDDNGGTHATVGGAAGISPGDNLQLFGEFNYIPLGSYNGGVAGVQTSASSRLLNFGGGVRVHFAPKGSKAKPFVVVVAGDGRTTASGSASVAGFSSSFSGSSSSVYAGGGGGVSIFAGEHWGFRPEFRYQRYVQNGGGNVLMFTAGVFFQLGR